ncbi:Scytalone dehydratase [Penicillium argentinense]|uniref:Scytalone dehydratase n=1 Tax=Penicillium argentinense TaxID=1131581 RepID=A0A9W9K2B9_9EURO|nr:Scytalone dehydratase [Penicillium argentinense]KAJ5090554.1 Scytalone dehydratase [Penicillium argentinense]
MSSADFVGDPLIRIQHLVGAAKHEWVSGTKISVTYQIRAAQQRYENAGLTIVAHKGLGNWKVKHWYKKIEGVWKLADARPECIGLGMIFPRYI